MSDIKYIISEMNRYHATEVYSYPAKIIHADLKQRIIRKTAIKVRDFDMIFSNIQNDCMYQVHSYTYCK
jgi:hypothetical protein